jgi:hypothetical protein
MHGANVARSLLASTEPNTPAVARGRRTSSLRRGNDQSRLSKVFYCQQDNPGDEHKDLPSAYGPITRAPDPLELFAPAWPGLLVPDHNAPGRYCDSHKSREFVDTASSQYDRW